MHIIWFQYFLILQIPICKHNKTKRDVQNNIDTYSIEDIEAKLSVICVRNKVSFDTTTEPNNSNPTTYSLGREIEEDDSDIPAWVKAMDRLANNWKI